MNRELKKEDLWSHHVAHYVCTTVYTQGTDSCWIPTLRMLFQGNTNLLLTQLKADDKQSEYYGELKANLY